MLLFSIFVIIESLFIGLLCFEIFNMDASANREFEAARLSQDVGLCMRSFSKTLNAISDYRRNKSDKEIARIARETEKNFDEQLGPLITKMSETGSDKASLDLLRKSSRTIFQLYSIVDDPLGEEEKKKLKLSTSKYMATCYTQFTHQLKHLKSIVLNRKPSQPLMGIAPEQLLQLSAALNLLYLIALFLFVERNVSKPLTSLSEACELIRLRKPISLSNRAENEIGTLQDSFVMMSEKVVENEKRRKSYIVMLQNVQLSALKKVKALLMQLSKSSSLCEKALARLSKTVSSASTLEDLLVSMTEQLESAPGEKITINYQPCSSKELLNKVLSSVDSLAQSRGILLKVEGLETDYQFSADPLLISRILLNLISNAIKYSPDNATVEITGAVQDGHIKFSIKDEGPGITDEGQQQLFKRYSQLEAVDGKKRAGTGLGLAICKDFVEAHGGSIACRSKAGAGSLFWFSLPLEKPSAKESLTQSPSQLISESKLNEKFKLIRSIKTGFLALLLAFVSSQAFLFFSLNRLLSQSTERNNYYIKQKELLFDTEDLFMNFVRFENRMQRAALTLDLQLFKNCLRIIKQEEKKVRQIMPRAEKNSAVVLLFQEISTKEKDLINLMLDGLEHAAEVLANPDEMAGKVEKQLADIDTAWSKVLDEQNKGYQSSYDFSRELRNQILEVLSFAALTDILLIGGAMYVGLNLVGKVLILKSKTETFAGGGHIEASLKGADELCFLDKRLCEVAGEIRDAEMKRKELLAIINHDLRTPLSSILGTIENLSQNVFGRLCQSDAALTQKVLFELQTLLTQINDLLLLEKLESQSYKTELKQLCLSQVFEKCSTELHDALQHKQITITSKMTPEQSKTLNVLADEQLTGKIIEILLKNAIAASPEGSTIGVEYADTVRTCSIQVDNDGEEIPADLKAQLFNRFRFFNGEFLSGFGLPLAAEAAKVQSSSIDCCRTETGRTAFRVEFQKMGFS